MIHHVEIDNNLHPSKTKTNKASPWCYITAFLYSARRKRPPTAPSPVTGSTRIRFSALSQEIRLSLIRNGGGLSFADAPWLSRIPIHPAHIDTGQDASQHPGSDLSPRAPHRARATVGVRLSSLRGDPRGVAGECAVDVSTICEAGDNPVSAGLEWHSLGRDSQDSGSGGVRRACKSAPRHRRLEL